MRGAARLWIAAPVLLTACKSATLPPMNQAELFKRGRSLFTTHELVTEGGRTCVSCHEGESPFEAYRLARQLYDLPSLVSRCLLRRTQIEGPEEVEEIEDGRAAITVRALQAYVVHRYIHDGVVYDENDEGIRRLGESMHLFLEGEYDAALDEVRGAHRLIRTRHYHVKALVLEGCIHVFRIAGDEARRAFTAALEIEPDAAIDANLFSPKVGLVLEETRTRVTGKSGRGVAAPATSRASVE